LCGYDAESYAGVIFATGRASHAGQVKDDDPNKEEISTSSKLGVGREAILIKNLIAEKPNNGRRKDNTGQRNDRNVRIT
jgi:hypothetical protein